MSERLDCTEEGCDGQMVVTEEVTRYHRGLTLRDDGTLQIEQTWPPELSDGDGSHSLVCTTCGTAGDFEAIKWV